MQLVLLLHLPPLGMIYNCVMVTSGGIPEDAERSTLTSFGRFPNVVKIYLTAFFLYRYSYVSH